MSITGDEADSGANSVNRHTVPIRYVVCCGWSTVIPAGAAMSIITSFKVRVSSTII